MTLRKPAYFPVIQVISILVFLLVSLPAVRAWVLDGAPPWPDGTVTLHLKLNTGTTYSDGKTPNATGLEALNEWNPYIERVQLAGEDDGSGQGSNKNGVNEVFFAKTVYGQAFDTLALAVTVVQSSNTARTEADVIVNSADTWDAYHGAIGNTYDLRRVLAHEFGHVLGLDHPDQHGQGFAALMDSTISDTIETPQADDIEGVCTLYGYRPDPTAPAPTISWNLDSTYSAYVGDSITLSISTDSFAPIYQWYKDGVAIKGAYNSYYSFASASASDSGTYTCVLTTAGGSVTSRACQLTVNPVPAPVITRQPTDVAAYITQNVSFSVYATGPYLKYQWTKDGAILTGQTESWLDLNKVQASDAGKYSVTITNSAGSVTSLAAQLTVSAPPMPQITSQPASIVAPMGTTFFLSVNVDSPVTVTYQWYHNGIAILYATSSDYYVQSASPSDAGSYTVTITDPSGSVTSSPATVTISPEAPPPSVVLGNQVVTLGSPFSYSVGIISVSENQVSSYQYQWYHNGMAIPGATSDIFSVQSAAYSDAGEYFLVSTDQHGTYVSQTGYVTVTPSASGGSNNWLATRDFGNVAYFLFANTPRVERYDLSTESWLASIPLAIKATCLAVNANGIFINDANHVYRMDLDGSNGADWGPSLGGSIYGLSAAVGILAVDFHESGAIQIIGFNTYDGSTEWTATNNLFSNDHILYLNYTGSIYSFDQTTTASAIDREAPVNGGTPYDYRTRAPVGVGTSSLLVASPDGHSLISDDGCVYDSSTLVMKGHVSPFGESVAFLQDGTIAVLAADYLQFFDSSYHQLGLISNAGTYSAIASDGNLVIGFTAPSGATGHPSASAISRAAMSSRTTALLVDPTSLAVRADASVVDNAGILYLYDRLRQNLFRWSTSQRAFISPAIPLQGSPVAMCYSNANNRIYLAYADEHITQIRLDLGDIKEVPFAYCGNPPTALCAIGNNLLVYERSPADVYNATGDLLSRNSIDSAVGLAWSDSLQQLYYTNTNLAPALVFYIPFSQSGQFGIAKWVDNLPIAAASDTIVVSPDGTEAAFGSGIISSVKGAGQLGNTASPFIAGAWLGNIFYSALNTTNGITLSRWNGTSQTTDEQVTIAGEALSLFSLSQNRLLLLSNDGAALHYIILDQNLNQLSDDGPAATDRMIGLSSRASVGTGDNILVSGFVITGNQPKQVVVRAIGPGLAQFNITNPIGNPKVEIYDSKSNLIYSNDDWGTNNNLPALTAAMKRLGNFALPDGSTDAAMLVTLPPGTYTAQVKGVNSGTGVGMLEIYDADEAPGTCRMTCLSSRAQVGTGDNILVSGFIISGTTGKTVLIRADGPSISQFGVSGVLANPQIKLFQNTTQIASNDDWCSDPTQVAAIEAAAKKTGLFALPEGSKDSAILIHLAPGLYTAQVSGSDGGSGVAMLEVYEVPQ